MKFATNALTPPRSRAVLVFAVSCNTYTPVSMLYLVASRCSDSERKQLAEAIAELSLEVWPAFDNIWVVQSEGSAVALRDLIGAKVANETVLLVALLAGHAAWQGFDPESEDWLLAYL